MNKILSTGSGQHTRFPLKDISNAKIHPDRIIALNYNKSLLEKTKKNIASEMRKRLEAEQKIADESAKRREAEQRAKQADDEVAVKDSKLVKVEQRAKQAEDEVAQLRAMLAALQGKK